jgi:uncharacterized protein YgbK (DUF1537 family)
MATESGGGGAAKVRTRKNMPVKVVFYGDDFTGASDNSAQYNRHGLKSLLFFSDPGEAALHEAAARHDVIGVAGTARSLATEKMADELLPTLKSLKDLGAPIMQYKCCSTFDSSAAVGSLGEAVRLMRSCWPDSFVPVIAATPEFGRYTMFGHHFARLGNDIYRLDRHPTMARHPVTPMSESDLSRILAAQGFIADSLVDLRELDKNANSPDDLAETLIGKHSAVFDGFTARQVTTAAASIWHLAQTRPVTAIAAQGFAYGLGRYFREAGLLDRPQPIQQLAGVDRLLVLSGSCSPQSAAQISWARNAGFFEVRLDAHVLLDPTHRDIVDIENSMITNLQMGRSVIVYTASGPDDQNIALMQERISASASSPAYLADRIGTVFARLARSAIELASIKRLVVAGGDSSSFAMRHLGADALEMQASHFEQNAHVGQLQARDKAINGIEVLLKGGQVGAPDLYGLMLNGF